MYSPKISDKNIPDLYWLARAQGRPMTKVVNDLLREFLAQPANQAAIWRQMVKYAAQKAKS